MLSIAKSLTLMLLVLVLAGQTEARAQRRQVRGQQRQPGAQQRPSPRFEDYPAREIFRGRPARILLDTRRARMYRTALSEGSRRGANFAGHYAVVWWGCGTGCAQLAAVDVKTGRAAFLPLEYIDIPDGENEESLRRMFRPDSRLLVVTQLYYGGARTYTAFYYLLEGGRFRLLQKRVEPRPEPIPEAGEPAGEPPASPGETGAGRR